MFWPAPPTAPFAWQAPQLCSLKIGPRPSELFSVAAKFASAAANVVPLVPGSAPPSTAPSVDATSSGAPHPTAPIAVAANKILIVLLNIRNLLGVYPRVRV